METSGISSGFPLLFQSSGQVPHVLRTRSPLDRPQCCHWLGPVRLACVKHAASVRPEPGSNSPSMNTRHPTPPPPQQQEQHQTPESTKTNPPPQRQKARSWPKQTDPTQHRAHPISTKGITHETNHTNHNSQHSQPHRRGKNLASTYGTLLSSQRTDAHRNPPLGELSGACDSSLHASGPAPFTLWRGTIRSSATATTDSVR